jgi:hypothetical protein
MIDTALGPISIGIVVFIGFMIARSLYQSYQDGERRKRDQAFADRVMHPSPPASPPASVPPSQDGADKG